MKRKDHWEIVEAARAAAGGNVDETARELVEALLGMKKANILAFNKWLRETMLAANTTELLLVVEWACQAGGLGPVSGDGWEYWKGWLIAQGRVAYEAALADADAVAGLFKDLEDFLKGEEIIRAPFEAYEAVADVEEAPDSMHEPSLTEVWPARWPAERLGTEELGRRFPKMTRRFGAPPFATDV